MTRPARTLLLLALLLVPAAAPAALAQGAAHKPIVVRSDAAFATTDGVVRGSGTRVDPYVISGWTIDASSAHGIEIANTRAHVWITGVTVRAAGSWDGIRVTDAENVTIENTRLEGGVAGLRATRSIVRAENSVVEDQTESGIVLDGSLFEARTTRASGAPYGLSVVSGVARVLGGGWSGTTAGLRSAGELWVADARIGGATGLLASGGNATLVGVRAEGTGTFADAVGSARVRVHMGDLGGATASARATPPAYVNLTDSWLGPDPAPFPPGVHGVPLRHPPAALSETRAWGGDAAGRRHHVSYLPVELAPVASHDLGRIAPHPGSVVAFGRAIYAVDAAGTVRTFLPTGEPTNFRVETGDRNATLAGGDGRLYVGHALGVRAVNLVTGQTLWEAGTDAIRGLVATELASGRTAVVAASDRALYAWDAATGAPIAKHEISGRPYGPAARGSLVAVATHTGYLHLFDLESNLTYPRENLDGHPTTPAIGEGLVWLGVGSALRAYSIRDNSTPGIPERMASSFGFGGQVSAPALAAGKVVVSEGQSVHVIDPGTGARKSHPGGGYAMAPVVVDGRALVPSPEGLMMVRLEDGATHRVRLGPPADTPAYGGEVAYLTKDGVLHVLAADTRPPAHVELSVEGTRVRFHARGEAPALHRVYVAGERGPWLLKAATTAAEVDVASLDLSDVAQGPVRVRVVGFDARGNAAPWSDAVVVRRGEAQPPAARVDVRVDAVVVANATGRAEGEVVFWNNGTLAAQVTVEGVVAAPLVQDATGGARTETLPPGGVVRMRFAAQVDPAAKAGTYRAAVRYAVDGEAAASGIAVLWDSLPRPEYRVKFVGGLSRLPNGTWSALLAVGNDGTAAGNVTVAIEPVGDVRLRLEPGQSDLRSVFALPVASSVRVVARIAQADPEDLDPSDNLDVVEATDAFPPALVEDPETPGEPVDTETNATGPLAGVNVAAGRFDGWLVEERAAQEFVVRVRANGSATLRLEVAEAAGLDVSVLDGPQEVGPGGEAVFRVLVRAPAIPAGWRQATLAFDVVDEDGRRTSTEVGVLVHARVALPGTTTRETMLGAAGLVAGAAVAVAAVGRENARWGLYGFLAPLYTRIRRQEVLAHGTRERIHAIVAAQPGVNLTTLGRELGLAPGVLLHHLHTLEREGYLTSRREGKHRRFFLPGTPAEEVRPLLTVAEAEFLACVERRPGLSQSELARELGMSRQLVNYHVKSLARRGLLTLLEDGRTSRVYPSAPRKP